MGTGFLGMASLAWAASESATENAGAQNSSVFNVLNFGAKGDLS